VVSGDLDLEGFSVCHEWKADDGRIICSSARREDEYLLSFPERASFHIDPAGVISCLPAQDVAHRLVRQLLLNQVLPCYLAHTGTLLLHASAVTLPNGKTLAFLGSSGRGKSTLASYCHQQGAQIIDDDAILLRCENQQISITGGVPTIRLLPDSLTALGHNPDAFMPYVDYSDKQQMRLPTGSTPGREARALDGLFLIAAPEAVSAVAIEPVGGQVAMMAVLNGLFSLDPSDPETMIRSFSQVAALLSGAQGLQMQHLSYPRRHDYLPTLYRALLEAPCA
jgi:hypothetical protein